MAELGQVLTPEPWASLLSVKNAVREERLVLSWKAVPIRCHLCALCLYVDKITNEPSSRG